MDYEKGLQVLEKLITSSPQPQILEKKYDAYKAKLHHVLFEKQRGNTNYDFETEISTIIKALNPIARHLVGVNFDELCRDNYSVIRWLQLAEIKYLFDKVHNLPSSEHLRAICRKCIPAYLQLPKNDNQKNTLIELINWLINRGDSKPLFQFMGQLMPFIQETSVKNKIKIWIHNMNEQLQLTQDNSDISQNNDITDESAPLYLLIQIEPQQKNLENYIAQAWLFRGENKIKQVYPAENHEGKTFTLKTLPELVAELLDSIEDYLAQPLTMEFILPQNLLNHHIEDICLPDDKFPIGIDYRIIIRSWERLQHKPASRRCRRYWNLYKTMSKKIWIHVEQDCCSILDDGAIFFGLSFPPSKKYLLELIDSGVPIMLWPKHRHPEKITQQIQEFISNRQLEELPERIRKIRRQFWQITNKQHTGYLSLLWEGSDRIPPKPQLQAPDLQL